MSAPRSESNLEAMVRARRERGGTAVRRSERTEGESATPNTEANPSEALPQMRHPRQRTMPSIPDRHVPNLNKGMGEPPRRTFSKAHGLMRRPPATPISTPSRKELISDKKSAPNVIPTHPQQSPLSGNVENVSFVQTTQKSRTIFGRSRTFNATPEAKGPGIERHESVSLLKRVKRTVSKRLPARHSAPPEGLQTREVESTCTQERILELSTQPSRKTTTLWGDMEGSAGGSEVARSATGLSQLRKRANNFRLLADRAKKEGNLSAARDHMKRAIEQRENVRLDICSENAEFHMVLARLYRQDGMHELAYDHAIRSQEITKQVHDLISGTAASSGERTRPSEGSGMSSTHSSNVERTPKDK